MKINRPIFSVFIAIFLTTSFFIFNSSHKSELKREIASDKDTDCIIILLKFFPHQDEEMIKSRIKLNPDFHSFYRAFVPLYYDEFNRLSQNVLFSKILSFKGVIGGDPHFENIGLVMDPITKKVRLSINDIDDIAEGPLLADVVRQFISLKTVNENLSLKDYLKAYRKGLKKSDWEYSKHVQDLKDNYNGNLKDYLEKYISFKEMKFVKFKKPNRAITEKEKKLLEKFVHDEFPEHKLYDAYARVKDDGGSAGSMRYYILIKKEGSKTPEWIDIKENIQSSVDKIFHPENGIDNKNNKNFFFKSELIKTAQIGGNEYNYRNMSQFYAAIKIDDVPPKQFLDVSLDEAYALGSMHRTSLVKDEKLIEEYLEAIDEIPTKDINSLVKRIESLLQNFYKQSKKG